MAGFQKTSFRKKIPTKTNVINGTKPSLHNSQLLISSGIPALDGLIGGGIPVGSILLINEDEYGSYAKFILKYFLAEGIVSHHRTYICSENIKTEEMIQELPCPVNADVEESNEEIDDDGNSEKMTIAWRYENLKSVSFLPGGHKHFGHYFDLSKFMSEKMIKNSKIHHWPRTEGTTSESFEGSKYCFLLESIRNTLKEGKYFAKQSSSERNILRICLHQLNSPLWQSDNDSAQNIKLFLTFFYSLRALIRNAFASCVITLPFSKYKEEIKKCIHLSDIVIQLESFTGTKFEKVAPFKDYHGFFIIQKVAAVNSLCAYNPKTTNLAFKLRRKKLVIEEFNLPPELEDSTEREQDDSSVLTCSTGSSRNLDF